MRRGFQFILMLLASPTFADGIVRFPSQFSLRVIKKHVMKNFIGLILFWMILIHLPESSQGALLVNVNAPKDYGQKSILKMELQNTFTEPIESARAVVFLMDDSGKVVGQQTRWILNGTKDKPALGPNAKSTFNFVVQSEKPFTKTKIIVTRIVLADGTLGDLNKDVVIKTEGK
jgi:hypothetical protein